MLVAAVALLLSFCVSWRQEEHVNGELVAFTDWGAVAMGGIALLLLVAARMEGPRDERRSGRLGILIALAGFASARIAWGLGLFT